MQTNIKYRFLPWARRGLSGSISHVDNNATLPARADIKVGITVSNLAKEASVNLSLYGPGDILGIDTQLIIGTTPQRNASNVEPNYFCSIEFDPPDFVWMFTPAKENSKNRLRPWLVLIVVDKSVISPPKGDRNHPLPIITIPADKVASELPNLDESWAWAHAQVLSEEGQVDFAKEMRNNPDLNVSRLLCPRRLKANKSYVACLVPAFDAGVVRGLGGKPTPEAPLEPAWSTANPAQLQLPVYYHWEFATGPLGDFESLARKLKPFASPSSVGLSSMYIGDADSSLPAIPSDQAVASIKMDGVLRSPVQDTPKLSEISASFKKGLQHVLNAPVEQLNNGPSDATPILGSPIYGQWHKNQHTVSTAKGWLNEGNLDPRSRVAAGLGAEVVRKYQEEFMQRSWEQVGEIDKANNQLNWGRLSLEINRHTYNRHFKTLADDRFFQITRSLHKRTLYDSHTIVQQVHKSSMPNSMTDMAFRRLTSPQQPRMQKIVSRLENEGRLSPGFKKNRRSNLVNTMATGHENVDPNRFTPDGLINSTLIESLVDDTLKEIAGVAVDKIQIRSLKSRVRGISKTNYQSNPIKIKVRKNIRSTGLVTKNQIDGIRHINIIRDNQNLPVYHLGTAINSYLTAVTKNPNTQGILLSTTGSSSLNFDPIKITTTGRITVGGQLSSSTATTVGHLNMGALGNTMRLGTVFDALPPNTLHRDIGTTNINIDSSGNLNVNGRSRFNARRNNTRTHTFGVGSIPPLSTTSGGVITTTTGTTTSPPPASNTLPLPVKNIETILLFESLVEGFTKEKQIAKPVNEGKLHPFSLPSISQKLRTRIDPRINVPLRMQQMINLDQDNFWNRPFHDKGINITETFDRVMAYPDLPIPLYQYLAGYSQESFCPGIGVIPPNSMTILETNPRFIEAFMLGVNYEMNRELLWRRYPTDQRGTPFHYFWDWVDGRPDIKAIHRWPKNNNLGRNTRGSGQGGQIVLLIRGELLLRYPNAVIRAWKANSDGTKIMEEPAAGDVRLPVFQGKLKPDVTFAGFDLTDDDLKENGGWFFLIEEQPTEPRFGLDATNQDSSGSPATWQDASWQHTGVESGGYLTLSNAASLTNKQIDSLRFGHNSAHMAAITLQKPMRIALHANDIIDEEVN